MADPTIPAPAPSDPVGDAKEFMRDNFAAYQDNQHPQHAKVQAEVQRLFQAAFPAPPKSDLSPELQDAANQPISRPPSLGPNDPGAKIPESPDGYRLTFPMAVPGSPPLDEARFLGMCHQIGLSSHQAQLTVNKFASRGAQILQGAAGGLSEAHLAELTTFAKGIGVGPQQLAMLVDAFESQVSARAGTLAAKAEAERLMADPNSGYFDRDHPRHAATRAKVRQLYADAKQDFRR